MKDPYVYGNTNILRNKAEIHDHLRLATFESDMTNLAMIKLYNYKYEKFTLETLQNIHYTLFHNVYDWAGEFRTVPIAKEEDILGGDTVWYAYPKEIEKQLKQAMKELSKLKCSASGDDGENRELVFKLTRIIATIWKIHPFREGNTRAIMVFAVLFANNLNFDTDYELFKKHAAYVRNAFVWTTQGMYAKPEYLDKIFADAMLHQDARAKRCSDTINEEKAYGAEAYRMIDTYDVNEYCEKPHYVIEEDDSLKM